MNPYRISVLKANIILVFFVLILSGCDAYAACSPADFTLKTNWQKPRPGYVQVNGELFNNCAEATGAQIKIVFRDAAGNVVEAADRWPASTRNIPAHGSEPFSMVFSVNNPATMEAKVIDTKKW